MKENRTNHKKVYVPLVLSAMTLAVMSTCAWAQTDAGTTFNDQFLELGGGAKNLDLSIFAFGNRILPGTFLVDIVVNEERLKRREVRFDLKEGKQDADPCLTLEMFKEWGLRIAPFPALQAMPPEQCLDVREYVSAATVSYDANKQMLTVTLPQAALERSARGSVSRDQWDKGINAALLDYRVNFSRSDTVATSIYDAGNTSRNSLFAGLRSGINLGDWRFRHQSTYNRGTNGVGKWQTVNAYAQRDVADWNSRLTLGDGTSFGNVFEGIQFRGVQIASDDSMLPDSLRGYAPVVRGVAQTNAKVEVRQNGYVIYESYVAPGPFVIDDLYTVSGGGNLQVTVTEADGRKNTFIQAYTGVFTLLRESARTYSATFGQYRDGSNQKGQPIFAQGNYAYGYGDGYTLYGGMTIAGIYQSIVGGVGKDLGAWGGLSFDVTHARTPLQRSMRPTENLQGQSLRLLYAKTILPTSTNVTLAGYRYSTSGYRTFPEAVRMRDTRFFNLQDTFFSKRAEVQLAISQPLGAYGSFSTTATQQSFWGTQEKNTLLQLGYNNSFRQISYGVYLNYNTNSSNFVNRSNRSISFNMSIPLGDNRASASYSFTHDKTGGASQQAGVYGSALEGDRLRYSVTGGKAGQGGGTASAYLSYLSQVAQFDAGRSQGAGYGQTTLSMSGGVVAHANGVTFSQPLGETVALIRAPGASDVSIGGNAGIRTDNAGNAVVSNITPYRNNRLLMDTRDLGEDVDLKNAALNVVPTRGAVVMGYFETVVGHRAMIDFKDKNGTALPFGARIESTDGKELGIVGAEGKAFVAGLAPQGELLVRWGGSGNASCKIPYALPSVPGQDDTKKRGQTTSPFLHLSLQCTD